jgi:hypothetical protein
MKQNYSTTKNQEYASNTINIERDPERIPADKLLIDDDSNIKQMRWEANKLIKKLMTMYSGYFDEEIGEKTYFVRQHNWPRTLNFSQTLQVVQYLTAVINSVTSLANTYDHAQANAYTESYASSLRQVIFGSPEWDSVDGSVKAKIYREIVNITSIQMHRGLKSNENKLSNTQIVQQEGTQSIREEQTINTRGRGFSIQGGKA